MTEEQFMKLDSLRNRIRKNRDILTQLKNRCFISIERNEVPTYIQDDEVRAVLINFFEEKISKLEKEFAEL